MRRVLRTVRQLAFAILAGITLLTIVAMASGCGSPNNDGQATGDTAGPPAATEWDIRGRIVSVFPAEGAARAPDAVFGTIIVEGTVEKDTAYDKASISISPITLMTMPADKAGGHKAIQDQQATAEDFGRLKPGMMVQATFAGPVAESYPVQGGAGSLEVLKGQD